MRLAVHSSKLSAKNSVLNKENVHSELIVNRCPVTIYRQSGASEPNPQQQGLKPANSAAGVRLGAASEPNPQQQGLKPFTVSSLSALGAGFRAQSTTTRIETNVGDSIRSVRSQWLQSPIHNNKD